MTFEQIYDKHHHAMTTYAASLMRDMPDEVEDIMQDVYICVFRNMEHIGQMNDVGARVYLMKTVENAAWKFRQRTLPQLKQQMPLDETAWNIPAGSGDILESICAEEGFQMLIDLIRTMPPDYRDILYLYYLSHLTLKQISAQFDMNYYAVKKRFQRGKALLQKRIRQKGVER
jgi:RNA polymerase sigma-70 factor (ECF subfamily)